MENQKKILELIQTLFVSMNKVHELVASRLRSKTKLVFASSTGYSIMTPAICIRGISLDSGGQRIADC